MKKTDNKPLEVKCGYDPNVVVLTLFPGIQETVVRSVLYVPGLKGVILKTFGTGNAPHHEWLLKLLKDAVDRGIVVVNVTQCMEGAVDMTRYETGLQLLDTGVVGCRDITTESALTKLMVLLGTETDIDVVRKKMTVPIAGEISC